MPDKQLYEYAIIRYVPRVERGEFINIGVILMAKRSKYLDMKYRIDAHRIQAFDNEVNVGLIEDYLKAWESVCQGSPEGGKIGELEVHERFRWLTAARSTIIQSSEVHPGFCSDPSEALEHLFEKFVA